MRYADRLGDPKKILVRATNWVGDAVMSLPALRAIRRAYPHARITVVAKPWVADLYARETFATEIVPYTAASYREKLRFALGLRRNAFDCAILLQNAFEAAAIAYLAGIPERVGYARDGRGFLLAGCLFATPRRRSSSRPYRPACATTVGKSFR